MKRTRANENNLFFFIGIFFLSSCSQGYNISKQFDTPLTQTGNDGTSGDTINIPDTTVPSDDTGTVVAPDDGEDPAKPDVIVDVTHPDDPEPTHYCCQNDPDSENLEHSIQKNECLNLRGRHEKVLVCHNAHDLLVGIHGWCNGHRKHQDDHLGTCAATKIDQKVVTYTRCDDD